jgi:hypothetical protein
VPCAESHWVRMSEKQAKVRRRLMA